MTYLVTINFNSARHGTGRTWRGSVQAAGPVQAADVGIGQAVNRDRGGPIYVTGIIATEVGV